MKYVKLINNTKIPIKQSSLTNGLNFDEIKTDKYNMGLLMGANNLICLDIDIKDDGLNEFNYYIKSKPRRAGDFIIFLKYQRKRKH